ncbi:hypothetical protein MMPV_000669 [Pyropia vietnamensis]
MQDAEGVAGGVLAPPFASALTALPVVFDATHRGPSARGGRPLAPAAVEASTASTPALHASRSAAAAPAEAPPTAAPVVATGGYWVRLRELLKTHLGDERLVRAVAADMQRSHMRWVASLAVDEVEALAGGVMLPRQRRG